MNDCARFALRALTVALATFSLDGIAHLLAPWLYGAPPPTPASLVALLVTATSAVGGIVAVAGMLLRHLSYVGGSLSYDRGNFTALCRISAQIAQWLAEIDAFDRATRQSGASGTAPETGAEPVINGRLQDEFKLGAHQQTAVVVEALKRLIQRVESLDEMLLRQRRQSLAGQWPGQDPPHCLRNDYF